KDVALLRKLPSLFGVVVPKVEDDEDLQAVRNDLARDHPQIRLIGLVESIRSVSRIHLWRPVPALVALGLGMEDLFSEVPLFQEEAEDLLRHLRLKFVVG